MTDISKSIDACAKYYGDDEAAMRAYLIDGEKRALALDNRGPIQYDDNGNIHPTILDAYARYDTSGPRPSIVTTLTSLHINSTG